MLKSIRTGSMQITVLSISFLILIASCSNGSQPNALEPVGDTPRDGVVELPSFGNPGHQCWGIWQFIISRTHETVELVPLREGSHHLNVLGFLEPPALTFVSINWDTFAVDFPNNYLETGVILRHPFLGMNEFTGFDVKGILITDGTYELSGPSEIFAGSTEPRLANPDGLTRWWNPSEFLGNAPYGYTPGLLGAHGGASMFRATLNGYKYFCKGLLADSEVTDMNFSYRGQFPAGDLIERKYEIDFGDDQSDFLVFNYAVDASWEFPDKLPPVVPDDFCTTANMLEPFMMDVDVIRSGLYYIESADYGGGWIEMDISVYDWQGSDTIGDVYIENTEVLEYPVFCTPQPDVHQNMRKFHVKTNATGKISSNDPQDIIIKAFSTNGTYQQGGVVPFFGPPGSQLAAYHRMTFDVSDQPVVHLELDVNKALPYPQPFTITKDFSVIGAPEKAGVYYFGSNYEIYRYPLDYSTDGELYNLCTGFLNYSPDDLWGYPIMLAKLDMTQAGEFVMYSESTQAGFLPPYLIRDFAYQFNNQNDPFGAGPVQGISPGLDTGIMKVVDISATTTFDNNDCVFWIHVDDDAEPSTPIPGITAPLLYFRYPYGPDIFGGDIGFVTGSPVPEGPGPGYVILEQLKAFAVCGIPFTAELGYYDIVCGFLESPANEVEIYGINCSDPTDASNSYLTTITDFQGSPMDIEMIPAMDAGFDTENDWIAVLEQGLANQTVVEVFSHDGSKLETTEILPGQPVAMDVDPYNYAIHVWFKDLNVPGEPVYAAVFNFVS